VTALLLNRRVSGLIEEPSYVNIPLGGAGTVVLFGALVAPGTSYPPKLLALSPPSKSTIK
jgi:hypothetical protein